jgi:hypothetical protein
MRVLLSLALKAFKTGYFVKSAPTAARCVKSGIRPRYQDIHGVVRLQFREPPGDGTATGRRSKSTGHLAEALLRLIDFGIRHCAHELIAAVAKHEVIGTKSLL